MHIGTHEQKKPAESIHVLQFFSFKKHLYRKHRAKWWNSTLGYLKHHQVIYIVHEFDDSTNPTKFRGFDIIGGKKGLDLTKRDMEALLKGAVYYLEKRFMVEGIIKDLEILILIPVISLLEAYLYNYCNEELSRILNHFQPLFTSEISKQIKEEWLRLKLFVCKKIALSIHCGQE